VIRAALALTLGFGLAIGWIMRSPGWGLCAMLITLAHCAAVALLEWLECRLLDRQRHRADRVAP
jgi:hypothetical protein